MKPLDPFALSNLRSTETGIEGVVLWVSAGECGGQDEGRGPRVMIVPGENIGVETLKGAVAVTLGDPPEVLGKLPDGIRERVVRFVDANREALLRHWRGEIDSREMIDGLKRVARSPRPRGR